MTWIPLVVFTVITDVRVLSLSPTEPPWACRCFTVNDQFACISAKAVFCVCVYVCMCVCVYIYIYRLTAGKLRRSRLGDCWGIVALLSSACSCVRTHCWTALGPYGMSKGIYGPIYLYSMSGDCVIISGLHFCPPIESKTYEHGSDSSFFLLGLGG